MLSKSVRSDKVIMLLGDVLIATEKTSDSCNLFEGTRTKSDPSTGGLSGE